MTTARKPHLCVLGMGGSVDETLASIAPALRARAPGLRITLIDLQPCHLRAPGRMHGRAADHVVPVTPADLGMRTPLSSWSLNLALNGGGLAYRRMVAAAGRYLADLGADAVLCCHDRHYAETAFLRAARQSGVPTVLLQEGPFCVIGHGAANHPLLRLKYALAPLGARLGLLPGMPDYGTFGHDLVMAASPSYAARWRAVGVPEERIAVTGIPRYDPLHAAVRPKAGVSSQGKEDAKTAKVCVLLQPFGAHGKVDAQVAAQGMKDVASGLSEAVARLGFTLFVRPHPRLSTAETQGFTRHLTVPWTLDDSRRPLVDRLGDLDVVVGFYSSGLLEAAAIGVPAVCFRLPSGGFAEPGEAAKQDRLAELGLPAVGLPADLGIKIEEALRGVAPETTPEAEIGRIDGRAATRVAEALAPLLIAGSVRGGAAAVTPEASPPLAAGAAG